MDGGGDDKIILRKADGRRKTKRRTSPYVSLDLTNPPTVVLRNCALLMCMCCESCGTCPQVCPPERRHAESAYRARCQVRSRSVYYFVLY